jgi:dipeptidyl-peptidase 9
LETSEKQVEQVLISKSNHNAATDSVRYPRAGQPNAKSILKIVEFDLTKADIVHKQLWNLESQFPWVEYIARFGWISNGER